MNHIFQSMKGWIGAHERNPSTSSGLRERKKMKYSLAEMPEVQASLLVSLIITDNEEWTLDQTVKSLGFDDVNLKKRVWWGIETDNDDVEAVVNKIVETGELANLNKEKVETIIEDSKLQDSRLQNSRLQNSGEAFLVQQMDDMKSMMKTEYFQSHYPELKIKNIHRGILWTLEGADGDKAKEIVDKFVLHNPHSMTVAKFS